ncbi:gamma-glutamyl-gamma-aminobutyrate hydrolase family protein [Alphaproteobacteria bacterium]|nr:gamma-glutamyl-gamma-aminobutyrate hydrolase family protein [Alphaproteobacteria bacterium]
MKNILISQKVINDKNYNESLDCIDQRWYTFFNNFDATLIMMPNDEKQLFNLFTTLTIDGFILTGGNDLISLGGDAKERDDCENVALSLCIKKNIPVIGVCRGMQFIASYFNLKLVKIFGHSNVNHKIIFKNEIDRVVNSYHNYGIHNNNSEFNIIGKAPDKTIEAIKHITHNISGIMWHPERNKTPDKQDLILFKNALGLNL